MMSSFKEIELIRAEINGTYESEVKECLGRLKGLTENKEKRYWVIDVIINSISFTDFKIKESLIKDGIRTILGKSNFVLSVIPQKLVNNQTVIQVTPIRSVDDSTDSTDCLHIKTDEGNLLVASFASFTGEIEKDLIYCFEKVKQCLTRHNLEFGNVVRQWNYVGNILSSASGKTNYQVLNDIRSDYYNNSSFPNGYPAATGIGMDYPGIIIKIIAIKAYPDIHIVALDNPSQIPAYKYSERVLAGKTDLLTAQKATPKFERAKAIISNQSVTLFVSGTASIIGESAIGKDSPGEQTKTVLDLISQLISLKNLRSFGKDLSSVNLKCKSLWVYVKRQEDAPVISSIIESLLPGVPYLLAEADVCRDELLVEIEGIFEG